MIIDVLLTLMQWTGGELDYHQDHFMLLFPNHLELVDAPEYELTTRWHFQIVFVTFQKSNMAAGNWNALKSA